MSTTITERSQVDYSWNLYFLRILTYLLYIVILLPVFYEERPMFAFWIIIFIQGFFLAHIEYLISSNSKNQELTEKTLIYFDGLVGAIWIGLYSFPFWFTYLVVMIAIFSTLCSFGYRHCLAVLSLISLVAWGVSYITPIESLYISSMYCQIVSIVGVLTVAAVGSYLMYYKAYQDYQVNKHLNKSNKRLMSINKLLINTSVTLNLDDMVKHMSKVLQDVFKFDLVAIQLPDTGGEKLLFYAAYGKFLPKQLLSALKDIVVVLKKKESMSDVVFRKCHYFLKSVVTPETHLLPVDKILYDLTNFLSIAMFPIVKNKKVIGVITFLNHFSYSNLKREDITVIEQYVSQVAIVINNAKMYKKIKENEKLRAEQQKKLAEASKRLSYYVSPQIFHALIESGSEIKISARKKYLIVFSSDIAGFTALTEKVENEVLTSMLNNYLTKMSEIAIEYGGTIDKYIGDAISIYFGDPKTKGKKEDAVNCVRMSIKMLQYLEHLKDEWIEEGFPESMQIRIGISSGNCAVGNFGSDYHVDYTAVGSVVYMAANIQAMAVPGEILVTREVFELIRDNFICQRSDNVKLTAEKEVVTYKISADQEV